MCLINSKLFRHSLSSNVYFRLNWVIYGFSISMRMEALHCSQVFWLWAESEPLLPRNNLRQKTVNKKTQQNVAVFFLVFVCLNFSKFCKHSLVCVLLKHALSLSISHTHTHPCTQTHTLSLSWTHTPILCLNVSLRKHSLPAKPKQAIDIFSRFIKINPFLKLNTAVSISGSHAYFWLIKFLARSSCVQS